MQKKQKIKNIGQVALSPDHPDFHKIFEDAPESNQEKEEVKKKAEPEGVESKN